LAHLLSCGLLKAVNVPDVRKREDRELLRTREQIVRHRRHTFQQILGKLRFHGMRTRFRAVISKAKRSEILSYPGLNENMRFAFEELLNLYDFQTKQLQSFRRRVLALAESEGYRRGVDILRGIPGVGLITAISWFLELPAMKDFESNEKLGSYLGLTPSEYSSGESQRQGRITRCGNARVRALLVQCAWKMLDGDKVMRQFYDRIKRRRGGKRAIVAVARKLGGRMRTVLLKNEPYQVGLFN
jgi:transposase